MKMIFSILLVGLVVSANLKADDLKKVVYTCQFSKFTNGIGVAGKSTTLHLTPGTDALDNLYIGDYRAELDFYWLAGTHESKGVNMAIWHEGGNKEESSIHADEFTKYLHLNMQSAGPDHYTLNCSAQFIN